MIQNKKVLAVIPARGGSKGLPGKNVAKLQGKTLIEWTWRTAKASLYIDEIFLSTDDLGIIKTAQEFGAMVPFVRPSEFASDSARSSDVILHALSCYPGYDYIVMLQPTSPFRIAADIDACLEKCMQFKAPACVTLTEADQSPYWMYSLSSKQNLVPVLEISNDFHQRQNLPQVSVLNGAVYVAEVEWFKQEKTFLSEATLGHLMPKDRSIDIDSALDLKICEWITSSQN